MSQSESEKLQQVVELLANRAKAKRKDLKPDDEVRALAQLARASTGCRRKDDIQLMIIKQEEKKKHDVFANGIQVGANVLDVSWSPNGRFFAVSSVDPRILIYDPFTGEVVKALTGHNGPVFRVAWSPDGRYLASAGYDKTMRVWNLESGQLLKTNHHMDSVVDVAWSPNGWFISSCCGDRCLRIWELAGGEADADVRLVRTVEGQGQFVYGIDWSPDGRMFASLRDTGSGEDLVCIWDADSGQLIKSLGSHQSWIATVIWNPCLGSGPRMLGLGSGPRMLGWRATLAWSPDGQFLATGSVDKTACIWDIATGALIQRFTQHTDIVVCVLWSPNGRMLCSTSDNIGYVWGRELDSASGQWKLLKKLEGHTDIIMHIAWSPDGRFLLSGSLDKTIRIWCI